MRSERNKKKITQVGLANQIGIPQSQISVIETGKVRPNERTRAAIENVLGPIDWIETSVLPVRSGSYNEAVRMVKNLVAVTVAMTPQDKKSIQRLIKKYFN